MVKIGTVEYVKGRRCGVRIRGNGSGVVEMKVLKNGATVTGYAGDPSHRHGVSLWMPDVGDKVVCLLYGNGQGFVVGAI